MTCLSDRIVGRALLGAWAALIGVTALGEPLGRIEGMLFPVSNDARIEVLRESEEETVFVIPATKVRDCDYYELELLLADDTGRNRRIYVEQVGRERVDPPGPVTYGPFATHISGEDLETRSTALVTHHCHALFDTITRLVRPPVVD